MKLYQTVTTSMYNLNKNRQNNTELVYLNASYLSRSWSTERWGRRWHGRRVLGAISRGLTCLRPAFKNMTHE